MRSGDGALGFSTSRTIGHRAVDGEVVPGTYAAEDELFGIGSALGEAGTGVFELAPLGSAGEQPDDVMGEVDWMRRLSAAIDRPVSFALLEVDAAPDLWRQQMAESLEACADGAQLYPQVAGRPTGSLTGHYATMCLFADIPAYRVRAGVASPRRARRRAGRPRRPPCDRVVGAVVARLAESMERAYRRTFVLGDPPDYEPGPERSLAGLAAARVACRPWRSRTTRWQEGAAPGAALPADPELRDRRPRPCGRRCRCTPKACSASPTGAPTPARSATAACRHSC